MARTVRRARVSRETSRRKFVWARSLNNVIVLPPAETTRINVLADFENQLGSQLIGSTVVRIRGIIAARSTNVGHLVRVAALVEPEPPAGVVPTLAEGPYGRQYADWMMFEPFVTVGPNGEHDVASRMIDVKSSRKIEEIDDQLSLYAGTPGTGNTVNVSLSIDLSIGLKLP